MAAPPPRYIQPADVQGTPLARLLIAHPDADAAVFAHLHYADATPLRAACRGFRGAVAEHPWALPVPLPDRTTHDAALTCAVRTPAGLARWRAAFPAARTLVLAGTDIAPPLRDADVAPAAGWGLTGVAVDGVTTLSRAGLAALCGPALTTLSLEGTPQLSGADVAAATARAPRLRTVRLDGIRTLADGDLAAWGGVHDLDVFTPGTRGFTWDGVRHLTAVRELALPLSPSLAVWAGDAFRGLAHLARLRLGNPAGGHAAMRGHAGLFAPGGLPRSLRHVELTGLALEWLPGEAPDGGAALLRPLAGVPDVTLTYCDGVGDGGLCALAGGATRRLEVAECGDVAGERLAPLGRTLQELSVWCCDRFTGGGLGSLAALRRLTVECCYALQPGALGSAAAGCAALERVDVVWDGYAVPTFDVAAAEAALLVAAGGGSWTFARKVDVRGNRRWEATRRWLPAAPAPEAGGAGGAPVAAPAPDGDDAAATAAASTAPDGTAPPPARVSVWANDPRRSRQQWTARQPPQQL
jgi:hypothetical protein